MRDYKDLKIAVAGTGCVGLSIATLFSQNPVIANRYSEEPDDVRERVYTRDLFGRD